MKTSFSYKEIKEKGYKITRQREIVFDILRKANMHLSADEIYIKAKSRNPGIGLTTIYRTLEMLYNLGYVNKYDFGEGRARYELNDTMVETCKHHHHLVCLRCNRVIDYTDFVPQETELITKTISGISRKYGFKVQTHIIQFYGICKECQKRKNKNGRL